MGRGLKRVALSASIALTMAAAVLVATASAAAADPLPDLSSRAAIEQYLLSIGVDPADAVWQTGLKNYAGPSCPGVDWNCVSANAPIVQIAAPLGTNQYLCTSLDCVAVQVALGAGQNDADCERVDKHADVVVQECFIGQANTTGNNVAVINQSIEQKGSVVTARQVAGIEQTNESGRNSAGFHQVIAQSSQVRGTTQSQEAHQAATLDQLTTTGDNTSNIDQLQKQTQKASGGTDITQDQNTTEGADLLLCDRPGDTTFDQAKNQCAEVRQNSNVLPPTGGSIRSSLSQDIREDQAASSAETADQHQGTFPGGQSGLVDQLSSAPVTSEAVENMRQVQTASDVPESEVEQSQFTGDPRCCQNQATNLASMADITQMTNQLASDPDAVQDAVLQGDCDSTGSCHVFQSATIDGDTESNECGPAPSCHIFTFNSQGDID